MKVAIVSDTHDQVDKVELLLKKIKELKCQAIIHCGDWCSPFVAADFGAAGLPIYTSMGNNDGDRDLIKSNLEESDVEFQLEDEILEVTLDEKRFGVNHYPDIVPVLKDSGHYDVICYGHNHERKIEQEGQKWIINPGALVRNRAEGWGFVVYDTIANTAELVQLG